MPDEMGLGLVVCRCAKGLRSHPEIRRFGRANDCDLFRFVSVSAIRYIAPALARAGWTRQPFPQTPKNYQ